MRYVIGFLHIYDHAWKLRAEADQNCPQYARRDRFRTSDRHLAGCRVGQNIDIPKALAQLIERTYASYNERLPVDRERCAFSEAIE